MKAGLEVHQQLATGKLFCACPSEISEVTLGTFRRQLRASSGEDRSVDPAAAFQASRGWAFRYEIVPTSCLVDMDEEPPHVLNAAALDTALTFALLVGAEWVDEVQVMRKIVVDGSNTSGFQRTALIARDGRIEVGGRPISIATICLEEDSARKIREADGEVVFRLDRLGIPLVEVATGPEIASGAEAREVAQEIGALLRATRQVRRGLGTIREDVNVSEEGGHRIEIKGVQELGKIQEYVDREVARQRVLLTVRDELLRRGVKPPPPTNVDVSDLFSAVGTGPMADVARSGAHAWAIPLPGFSGLLRSPPGSEERLGRELADQARAAGLRGVLHSDELPAHGVGAAEVEELRRRLHLGENDAFVLIVDRAPKRLETAARRIIERSRASLAGVPGETRDPLPDGRTRYSRPLPGRDRMYPETDIAPIALTADRRRRLERDLPERPAALRARLEQEHGLGPEVVRQIVYSEEEPVFEELTGKGHAAALVVRLLYQDLPAVRATRTASSPFEPASATLDDLLTAVEGGRIAKEGIPTVLAALAEGAPDVEHAIGRSGLTGFSPADLDALVERVVRQNQRMIDARGEWAFSPLMGT